MKQLVEAKEKGGQEQRGELGWILTGERREACIGRAAADEVRDDPEPGGRCRRGRVNPQDRTYRRRIMDDDVGNKEAEARSITWRRYATHDAKEQPTVPLDHAIATLEKLRVGRMMDNFEDEGLPIS